MRNRYWLDGMMGLVVGDALGVGGGLNKNNHWTDKNGKMFFPVKGKRQNVRLG